MICRQCPTHTRRPATRWRSHKLLAVTLLVLGLALALPAGAVAAAQSNLTAPTSRSLTGNAVAATGTATKITASAAVFTPAPGTITGAVTWTKAASPYVVDISTTIEAGASLTIEPGVVVKFDSGAGLSVSGTLNALGTSSSPVTFTSINDDSVGGDTNADGAATAPKPGDWSQVWVNGGTAKLDYATVAYGGTGGGFYAALVAEGGTLSIDHSLFKDDEYGLDADKLNSLTLQNTSFVDNSDGCAAIDDPPADTVVGGNSERGGTDNSIELDGGVTGSLKLGAGGVYTTPLFAVGDGTTLTLSPGVIIKFTSDGGLEVLGGTLNALGSSSSPVVFTSIKDDSVGGDTNGDGAATAPRPGDWGWILVEGGTANLDYATVAYGGSGPGYQVALVGDYYSSNLHVNHSLFKDNESGLLALKSKSLTLQNTMFTGNTQGCADIDNPPAGTVLGGNRFGTGTDHGIQLEGTLGSSLELPAEGAYIVGWLGVPAADTLTIDPGAIIKFIDSYSGLDISGQVVADGTNTPAGRIHFTSLRDDSVGGDTNGDGAATKPQPGDWWMLCDRLRGVVEPPVRGLNLRRLLGRREFRHR